MTKILFGLTTASELTKAQQLYFEANETIERFNQENKKLKKDLSTITVKLEALKQDLAESKTWAEQLIKSNKDQADLLGRQQATITKALDEASQAAMLRNEATIEISALKLENKRYRETVQIAIDNLALEIK
jgi:ABC-type transporter Mla subunit MlaD